MRDQAMAALSDATVSTLETMCFTSVMGVTAPEPSERDIEALVRFDGDESGAVRVAFSAEAAQNATSGFLGLDASELDETKVRAVMLELANIICGSMLSTCNDTGHFRLEVPVETAPSGWPAEGICSFKLDIGAVRTAVAFAG